MMTGKERVQAVLEGKECDRLPARPMVMTFAAKHAGIPFGEYCRDGRKMATAQIKMIRDFHLDVVLTCSDPAREVVDIAGEESVEWFDDRPPAIDEMKAALHDKARLGKFKIPDPWREGRMFDRIVAIREMKRQLGDEVNIVGWVEGPLALAAIREYGAISRLHMCGKTDPLIPKMKLLPVDIYELDFPVNLVVAREKLEIR